MTATEFNGSVIKLSRTLRPYALSLTKDMEAAKDLVQDTILKALSSRDKYRYNTNLKAWLSTIMRNLFINGYRRKARQNTFLDTSENEYLLNNTRTEDNRGLSHLIINDIEREIEKLPDGYREPFLLSFNGFKYQEIADALGIPLGTVKSRIFLARKQLGDNLTTYRFANHRR